MASASTSTSFLQDVVDAASFLSQEVMGAEAQHSGGASASSIGGGETIDPSRIRVTKSAMCCGGGGSTLRVVSTPEDLLSDVEYYSDRAAYAAARVHGMLASPILKELAHGAATHNSYAAILASKGRKEIGILSEHYEARQKQGFFVGIRRWLTQVTGL